LESIRKQVAGILPGTRVIERRSKALARAEARAEIKARGQREIEEARARRSELRAERERLAAVMAPLAMLVCVIWIGIGAFMNVRGRRSEIGVLRAFGVKSSQVAALFLGRALLMGSAGALPGILLGGSAGGLLEISAGSHFVWAAGRDAVLPALLAAFILPLIASWIPAVLAARQAPAEVLREE
jgi:ABC-type lipoprotein release transport system permease subunit